MKILWTDGSAEPNPGPGGYAVIENGKPVVLGSDPMTTNIRMEGSALLEAMRYAGKEGCEIHTDSEFWVKVLTEWAPSWSHNGWRKNNNKPIKNLKLVKQLYGTYVSYPVKLVWTRGHVGTAGNELADRWANRARRGATLEGDLSKYD